MTTIKTDVTIDGLVKRVSVTDSRNIAFLGGSDELRTAALSKNYVNQMIAQGDTVIVVSEKYSGKFKKTAARVVSSPEDAAVVMAELTEELYDRMQKRIVFNSRVVLVVDSSDNFVETFGTSALLELVRFGPIVNMNVILSSREIEDRQLIVECESLFIFGETQHSQWDSVYFR